MIIYLVVSGAEPGVCGLLNMGNTCYLNAALQCLLVLPQLITFYIGKLLSCIAIMRQHAVPLSGEDLPQPSLFDCASSSCGEETNAVLSAGRSTSNAANVDGVQCRNEQLISFVCMCMCVV